MSPAKLQVAEPIEMLLGDDSRGLKEPCIRCGLDSQGKWAILGVVWSIEKHWESWL